MNIEDEKILETGPLNCFVKEGKDRGFKAVCTPNCANFTLAVDHITKLHKFRTDMGQPLTIAEIVRGLEKGSLHSSAAEKTKKESCERELKSQVTEPAVEA